VRAPSRCRSRTTPSPLTQVAERPRVWSTWIAACSVGSQHHRPCHRPQQPQPPQAQHSGSTFCQVSQHATMSSNSYCSWCNQSRAQWICAWEPYQPNPAAADHFGCLPNRSAADWPQIPLCRSSQPLTSTQCSPRSPTEHVPARPHTHHPSAPSPSLRTRTPLRYPPCRRPTRSISRTTLRRRPA
jgi:hypothetical protein